MRGRIRGVGAADNPLNPMASSLTPVRPVSPAAPSPEAPGASALGPALQARLGELLSEYRSTQGALKTWRESHDGFTSMSRLGAAVGNAVARRSLSNVMKDAGDPELLEHAPQHKRLGELAVAIRAVERAQARLAANLPLAEPADAGKDFRLDELMRLSLGEASTPAALAATRLSAFHSALKADAPERAFDLYLHAVEPYLLQKGRGGESLHVAANGQPTVLAQLNRLLLSGVLPGGPALLLSAAQLERALPELKKALSKAQEAHGEKAKGLAGLTPERLTQEVQRVRALEADPALAPFAKLDLPAASDALRTLDDEGGVVTRFGQAVARILDDPETWAMVLVGAATAGRVSGAVMGRLGLPALGAAERATLLRAGTAGLRSGALFAGATAIDATAFHTLMNGFNLARHEDGRVSWTPDAYLRTLLLFETLGAARAAHLARGVAPTALGRAAESARFLGTETAAMTLLGLGESMLRGGDLPGAQRLLEENLQFLVTMRMVSALQSGGASAREKATPLDRLQLNARLAQREAKLAPGDVAKLTEAYRHFGAYVQALEAQNLSLFARGAAARPDVFISSRTFKPLDPISRFARRSGALPEEGHHVLPSTPAAAFGALMTLDVDRNGKLDAADAQKAPHFTVQLRGADGKLTALSGPEALSHAADALGVEVLAGRGDARGLPSEVLTLPRTQAMERRLGQGWDALVRSAATIKDLMPALNALRLQAKDGQKRVYVPSTDPAALARLREEAKGYPGVKVEELPPGRDEVVWKRLAEEPGLLYVPRPYVVPGGIFNEMFGWDSRFMGEGTIASGRPELARDMLVNYVYLVEHYGKIPNSTHSYHLSRTQPPLMPRLGLEVDDVLHDPALLREVANAAEKELATVWMSGRRLTKNGLSRYIDDAEGPTPEIPAGLYDNFKTDAEFSRDDRGQRESGWDKSHRFGERIHHHEALDLNSFLFRYEKDLAEIHRRLDGKGSKRAGELEAQATLRAERMQKLYDVKEGLFFDYDYQRDQLSRYETAATFAPLWAGWATPEQARAVAKAALPRLLAAGGLLTSSEGSRTLAGGEDLQWDHPNGWAPLNVMAVQGLHRYGLHAEANAVAYRWLSALLDIAGNQNGLIKEKVDVVSRSAFVRAAEYGNQGGDRGEYLLPLSERAMGFGWTNASILVLLRSLPPQLRAALDQGVPPDVAAPIP